MNNLKKAALNISSKFGLLNSHRSLVLAISEEREVHETLLKLVLNRVNASTSLLRWAKKEENLSMKEAVCRLYDVSLMYASVQRELAEQSNVLNHSLKEILSHEVNLDALRKRLKDVTDKREKLERFGGVEVRKKSNASSAPADEIIKLKEDEENIRADLEVKILQTEIFKSSSIKSSLQAVCDAHLKYSEKLSLIFTAANKVVDSIKDVPDHLKQKSNGNQKKVSNVVESVDPVVELAKSLNINRPISSNMSNPSSKFHVDIGQSNGKSNQIKMLQKAELKKTISNPVLLSPPTRPVQDIVSKQLPSIPSNEYDTITPHNHRGRAKTSEIFWSHVYASGNEINPKRYSSIVNEYDEVDIRSAESFGRLYRSASDSTISSSKTNEIYSEPFDELDVVDHEFIHDTKPYSYSEPIDYECSYVDPVEKFDVKKHKGKKEEEQLYCEPVTLSENTKANQNSDNYENTEKIMDTVEYMDNQFMQEPLRSKIEILENIVLTKQKKSPVPPPKPKINKPHKKLYSSVRLPASSKIAPPRPKPRPNTALYESPTALNFPTDEPKTITPDVIGDSKQNRVGSVKEIAAHMSGRIQPASLVPSMTQAKLWENDNSDYQNI